MTDNHQPDQTDAADELVKAARTDRTAFGKLFDEFYPLIFAYLVERNNTDQVQRSMDEQAQDLLRLQRGFTFATALAKDEKWDAHYAGAGVKLGDADRPIFWYKPAGSEKYRVIYADLSAGEVDAAPIVADAVRLAP